MCEASFESSRSPKLPASGLFRGGQERSVGALKPAGTRAWCRLWVQSWTRWLSSKGSPLIPICVRVSQLFNTWIFRLHSRLVQTTPAYVALIFNFPTSFFFLQFSHVKTKAEGFFFFSRAFVVHLIEFGRPQTQSTCRFHKDRVAVAASLGNGAQ